MTKRILLPLDESAYTKTALEVGCAIAKQQDAEITGLVVLDIPGIERSVGPVPAGGLYYAERMEQHRQQEAQDRIDRLLEVFSTACARAGVRHRSCEHQGTPGEWIVQEAVYFDLVLMGLRTHYRFDADGRPGDTLDQLMDHTVTPVLGVPEELDLDELADARLKVVVAFDGSLPSARALKDFPKLIAPENVEVTLLTSDEDEATAQFLLERAKAYLLARSITNVTTKWTTEHIIKAVEDDYIDRADAFVVGAHSKRGLLDFMVGSLTKTLIQADSKPVLICQ